LKFLIEWKNKPEHRKVLLKLLKEYKQPAELKTIFPIHQAVGSNRGIAIVEAKTAEPIQQALGTFIDYIDYDVTPILPLKP
jgi:hypothetical protein